MKGLLVLRVTDEVAYVFRNTLMMSWKWALMFACFSFSFFLSISRGFIVFIGQIIADTFI